jgi:hypothetical protein
MFLQAIITICAYLCAYFSSHICNTYREAFVPAAVRLCPGLVGQLCAVSALSLQPPRAFLKRMNQCASLPHLGQGENRYWRG